VQPRNSPSCGVASDEATGVEVVVVDAVKRDLEVIGRLDKRLSGSALAETALALAALIDDPGNSATSKANCARALKEIMDRLFALAPDDDGSDNVDELLQRRGKRRDRRPAA
jgi:hypothetical protein